LFYLLTLNITLLFAGSDY
jgi:hypothetical protein